MSDDELLGNILHDLAGMMTSVQGLAQIVETQRDHASLDEFISMLSSESEKATHAVKDMQLIKAMMDGSPVEDLQRVTVSELFLAIRDDLSEDLRQGFAPPPPGLPDVLIDKDLLADLIARSYEAASQTNPSEEHHIRASENDGKVEIAIEFGPLEDDDIAARVSGGRKGMRPLAIAERLLPRWNGQLETNLNGPDLQVVLKLDPAQ